MGIIQCPESRWISRLPGPESWRFINGFRPPVFPSTGSLTVWPTGAIQPGNPYPAVALEDSLELGFPMAEGSVEKTVLSSRGSLCAGCGRKEKSLACHGQLTSRKEYVAERGFFERFMWQETSVLL